MKNLTLVRGALVVLCLAVLVTLPARSQDAPRYHSRVLDLTFVTADQLYSDNQMFMSAGPFIYPKPELHPFTNGVMAESYNYSRSTLGAVNARSGLGVHTLWGPAVGALAADPNDPLDRKQVLESMIKKFAKASGATPPAHAWPQFLEFERGNPHFAQSVDTDDSDGTTFANDFASLRWDRTKMSKVITPAALGQTLFKQVMWSEAFFSMSHGSKDGTRKLGGDAVEGFSGLVLTANSINKMLALKNNLAFNFVGWTLGRVEPKGYDAYRNLTYFPHRIAVRETPLAPGVPPRPSYTVLDRSSDLFDQASLLRGLSEFAFFSNPRQDAANPKLDANFDRLFDGTLFPRAAKSPNDLPGPFDLAKGLALAVYQNLKVQHFDPKRRVFVDRFDPVDGRGKALSAFDAGFVLVALANLQAQHFETNQGTLDVRGDMIDEADFIVDHVLDPSGGAYNGFTLDPDRHFVGVPDRSIKTLLAQATVIEGLLKAYEVTNVERYKQAATSLFEHVQTTFYDAGFRGFRTSADPLAPIVYDPRISGAILGALRELFLVADVDTRELYTQQFDTVVNGKTHAGTGLMLSETPLTGERGPLDSDNDGIPAMSATGVAPVLAGSIMFERDEQR